MASEQEILLRSAEVASLFRVDSKTVTRWAKYPIMGISLDSRFSNSGVLITSEGVGVTPGGPADKAGLKEGDVIIEFDGAEVENSDELIVMVRGKRVGDKVTIKYQRNNISCQTTVTLSGKLTSIRTLGGHRRYKESEVKALLTAHSARNGGI